MQALLKIFLYLIILTLSLTLNLGDLGLVSIFSVNAEQLALIGFL